MFIEFFHSLWHESRVNHQPIVSLLIILKMLIGVLKPYTLLRGVKVCT